MDQTAVNERQRQEWNDAMGRHWVAQQARLDRMLSGVTPALVAAAGISAADRVLDVGCGCGQTTRLAARRAAAGDALGVDLSQPMLEQARSLARREGVGNARFEAADAQTHDFGEGVFDVVLSRFGVMFFDAPQAAFANLCRALRGGGRLAFLCWQDMARNTYFTAPFTALAEAVPSADLLPGPPKDGPGPFSLADPRRLTELLTDTGFTGIAVRPVTERVCVGADVADAVAFVRAHPAAAALFAELDEETAARAESALRSMLTPHLAPGGVLFDAAAWLVTATRPAQGA
ncbi:MAG: class I SAM-dependent methyltransferase [Actinomadura sp.]